MVPPKQDRARSMLEVYNNLTPFRTTNRKYAADVKAIQARGRRDTDFEEKLAIARQEQVIEDKVTKIYFARRKFGPVSQNDVFEVLALFPDELDPTTQWPLAKSLLGKAKAKTLHLGEFVAGSIAILRQIPAKRL